MRFILGLLVAGLMTATAAAQPWYARGEFNGWTQDNPMTDQGGGHWTADITGLFDDLPNNFKIACCGADGWLTSMPSSDSRVYTNAAGEIHFHLYDQTTWDDGWFPDNVRRVGYDDHQQFDWEIVGSLNGWPGTHDPAFALTDLGNGLHRGTFTLDQGIYDFKFRGVGANEANAWDTSIGNNFGNGAGNNTFAVTQDDQDWTFELDLPNGRFRYFTEAAPPGNDGDYNDDGIVDAADYVAFRKYEGTTQTLPNDPNGGTIGSQQYNTWRQNFGNTGGAAAQWLVRSPQFADTPLVAQGGGVYTLGLTGLTAGSDYDIQAVKSDLSEFSPGSHAKIRADASGEINLTLYELDGASWGDGWFPDTANRFGYEDSLLTDWEIVGAFNGWPGANDPAFALTDQSNGLHTGEFTFNTPGTYGWKFRQIAETNPWNMSIGPDFGNSAGDNVLTITNPGEVWNFELDLPNGRWRAFQVVEVGSGGSVPEPSSLLLMVMIGLAACGASRRR